MVVDERGQKWACTSCVRGHRSAKCGHADRWLVAVKPSGRPRTSGCDHPDPQNCDCNGIRKVLMVAIPNDQKCDCTGDHTCHRGAHFYMTRVQKQEDIPAIPEEILAKRAEMSETLRLGGPAYAAQYYPQFYSKAQEAANSATLEDLQRPVVAMSPIDQMSMNQRGSTLSRGLPVGSTNSRRSCCHDEGESPPAAPTKNEESESMSSPTASHIHGQNFLPSFPNERADGRTMGTPSHPWTQEEFSQIELPQKEAQYRCKCGENCKCMGCLAHPFNGSMREEVGSLAQMLPLSSPTTMSNNPPVNPFSEAINPPTAGFDYNSHFGSSSAISTEYPQPPLIDSSRFSHFQYELPDISSSYQFKFTEDIPVEQERPDQSHMMSQMPTLSSNRNFPIIHDRRHMAPSRQPVPQYDTFSHIASTSQAPLSSFPAPQGFSHTWGHHTPFSGPPDHP